MALRRLTTDEMVSSTTTWVTPGHPDRLALESAPATAALVPEMIESLDALGRTHFNNSVSLQLGKLSRTQKKIDINHDDVLRGIWHYLSAAAYLASNESQRENLLRIRNLLLPEGLVATQKSYRQEAGQASLAAARLTAQDKRLLARIPTMSGTLLDAVNRWFELAASLGQLDRERTTLSESQTPAAGDALAARNRWIRVVQAIRAVLALSGDSSPEIALILARLAAVELHADRRSARGGGSAGNTDDSAEAGDGAEEEDADGARDEDEDGYNDGDIAVSADEDGESDEDSGDDAVVLASDVNPEDLD